MPDPDPDPWTDEDDDPDAIQKGDGFSEVEEDEETFEEGDTVVFEPIDDPWDGDEEEREAEPEEAADAFEEEEAVEAFEEDPAEDEARPEDATADDENDEADAPADEEGEDDAAARDDEPDDPLGDEPEDRPAKSRPRLAIESLLGRARGDDEPAPAEAGAEPEPAAQELSEAAAAAEQVLAEEEGGAGSGMAAEETVADREDRGDREAHYERPAVAATALDGTHQEIADQVVSLADEIGLVIVGYDDVVLDLVRTILAGGHMLLEGVPGVAKTTLAKAFAAASGLDFGRIQCTSDTLPADVTGHYYFNEETAAFEVRHGPIFHQVVLVDEVNRAPPRTQSAFLEAMAERQVTIEGTTHRLAEPFMVLATLNPVGAEVSYQLPVEELDRFFIRRRMGYLSEEGEREMLRRKADGMADVQAVWADGFVERAREALASVEVDEAVLEYLHAIGLATRNDDRVTLGASPRSLEDLLKAARVQALLDGRDYTVPADVKELVPRVLGHRILLSVDAEMEEVTAEQVLREILTDLPVPK